MFKTQTGFCQHDRGQQSQMSMAEVLWTANESPCNTLCVVEIYRYAQRWCAHKAHVWYSGFAGRTMLCACVTHREGYMRASTHHRSSLECCGKVYPLCSAEEHVQHETVTKYGDAEQRQKDMSLLL